MSLTTEETRTITIAGHDVEVLPQPPRYLVRRVQRLQDSLDELANSSNTGMTELLFGRLGHDLLAALIPDLAAKIPLHAWMGYSTEEAMDADELDETRPPHPPTFPEILAAFHAVKEVNEFDLFERLLGLVDPQMRRELMGDLTTDLILALTPNSQSNGDGSPASTSSTATPPTPIANGSGSPSPA